ncbi:ThyA Thymidylate synthase [uncultured Caudovirales phage]|uniref:thymidylate synthase n=1 Tax=uncultured Caudovirales phage TaxID=2100421 RepID=A0A6J5KXK6_9CAUD|nr:ThyA Thymidylate synthase [uncultured Caudovirales phage]
MNSLDKQYTELLQDILDNGVKKQDRTGTGTISVFGRQIRHNMKDGFSLLTTKKMPFKTIVTELLWFLRGDTNIKYLVDNNCHIWDGDAWKNYQHKASKQDFLKDGVLRYDGFINQIKTDDEFANKWGELGPVYGKQWRSWEGYKHGMVLGAGLSKQQPIDQIQNLINDLKTNPDSRRLMVNAWNVGELDQMVLPPCHYGFQVYTRELSLEERATIWNNTHNPVGNIYTHNQYDENNIPARAISLMWNQRSVDTFLGLPFNIASYGLLLEIIAKEVNMVPDELIGNLGDVHLYSNHLDAAKEQIGRDLTWEERRDIAKSTMDKREFDGYRDEEKGFWKGFGNITPFTDWAIHHWLDCQNIPKRTREPFPLPTLKFNPCPITGVDMEYQSIAQFEIENYQSHPTIKAPLSN